MRIVIVGGGKIGYYLTKTLLENGEDVSIIELSKDTGRYFANTLDVPVVKGDGTDESTLIKAGVEQCDTIIAVTGRDEVNLLVCQLARKVFKVPKTIAKVNNPKNVVALQKLGVDIVVSGTDNIIKQLEREVDTSAIKELLDINGGQAAVLEVTLPDDWVYDTKEILTLPIPEGCNIVSVTRDGQFLIPRGKTRLFSGDKLLVVTAAEYENDFKKSLRIKK